MPPSSQQTVECDTMPILSVEDLQPMVVASESNQFQAAGSLLERLAKWLKEAVGPLPSKAEVLEIVGKAYDLYVAPIDIPGVPNLIEPRIDAMLRVAVLVAAGKLYDRFAA
jgi:hypothetical protein